MKEKSSSKKFIYGTVVLMLFGLISKIIGAIYRIPLTKILTAEGMGIYQMVFPLYTLMLTISSSGLPSSISKIISECYAKNQIGQAKRVLKTSFVLLFLFSIVCSLVVLFGAKHIAHIQGNNDAWLGYIGIAPAILLVGMIAGFRGYFQGLQIMTPSAISGLIEQVVKLGFGLLFSYKLSAKGVHFAVFGAVLGISLSEFIALLYLFIRYQFTKNKHKIKNADLLLLSYKQTAKNILSCSIVVTLGGLIMPLTMLIDSVVVINLLKKIGLSVQEATALFGLQTGVVGSIVNMPVILSLSIATAILPMISRMKAKENEEGVTIYASKAVLLTIIISLPASVGVFTFSKEIIMLLYGKTLSSLEIAYASHILQVSSVGIFYLAMVQVSSGILQGISKFNIPLISLSIGAVFKIVLNIILVQIKDVNILGAEFSTVACYACAFIINVVFLIKYSVLKLDIRIFALFSLSLSIFMSKYLFNFLIKNNINFYFSLFMIIFLVVILYMIFVFLLYKNMLKREKKTKKNANI